ncbi:MAG: carboxypeptidase-like regulatory domain-containing protein [Bacteroidota bacterium]|nr:carboxypeptidase-like regulatory domain-containing protein [Bacteroidota bacterium]
MSILLFLVSSLQAADQNGLMVKLLNDKKKEIESGATSNVLFMFTNQADTEKVVHFRLNLPDDNWKQMTEGNSIQIEQHSSLNKIISIHVPDNVRAGDYSVRLETFEQPGTAPFATINIPINVKPRYEIRIDKQKAPTYLFSGDTLTVRFLIQNLSNIEVTITATVINGGVSKVSYLNIPKDSAIYLNELVSVRKDLNQYTQQHVTLIASVKDRPETACTCGYLFDVLPSGNETFDGYNRFPVAVSGILSSSNRWGERAYSTMYDIRGSGLLNESGKQKLEFHLRGPDRRGNPLFGLNDEYYLIYNSPHVECLIGDNNYQLSDLTESSRNGRGIKFQYNAGRLSLGSFYDNPRYYLGIKQVYAAYSACQLNKMSSIRAGYLSKTDTAGYEARLLTVSGLVKPFIWASTEFELAGGLQANQRTNAYKVSVSVSPSFFTSHFNYTYADKGFPGFITNSKRLSSGVTINLKRKFSLSANYDLNYANLALDTLYVNAPFSKNLNTTVLYRISPNNTICLGAYSLGFEDRAPRPLFNYTKQFGRIIMQSKFRRLELNVQGELGKVWNYLGRKDGDLTDFCNGYVSLNYLFNRTFMANSFLSYQGGKQYQITGFERFYYGGSLQANLKKETFVSLDYQNNYELKDYYRDRSLLSLQLHSQLLPHHAISLSTNYNLVKNSLNQKELSVQLHYTYTINVPISRKKDIGSLSGKVVGEALKKTGGILLNLNGNKTLTDKNGHFSYPMLKVGTYVLGVDESSLGLNTIVGTPGPYLITIEPGKVTQFNFTLTQAAQVQGRLVIHEDKTTGQKGYYPVKEEIDKLIIEAFCGNEVFRTLTSREGTFTFSDLRPGVWHIRVYPNGIPEGYKLVTGQFNLNLTPGKEEKIDVVVQKENRQIRFQTKF